MTQKKEKSALHVNPGVSGSDSLNPALRKKLVRKKHINKQELIDGILQGNTTALSRAITLIESTNEAHQKIAEEIVNACIPHSGKSFRIGISGVPGVGKSTFIESFGQFLIHQQNKKVAVLAVDPSSAKNKGSILGDKTRMENLSQEQNAFIRPSPSAGSLGGVARKTRETTILCEAAGFDAILIETVGVGQSETAVKSMVDYFLLLLLPGAGDELQGIKRGIMEMADAIAINKADGENEKKARHAMMDAKRALNLYTQNEDEWRVPVRMCSALENKNIDTLWEDADRFLRHGITKGIFDENRKNQAHYWLRETLTEELLNMFNNHPKVKQRWREIEAKITENKMSPFSAARELIDLFLDKK